VEDGVLWGSSIPAIQAAASALHGDK
jgi:hypothetical protein